ncbi:hypothetical protein WA556_003048, partial [Blastocystis sp. ATCC 50177/Nand II]
LVVCVGQQPLTYRHVNAWGEKGVEVNAEEAKTNELLAQLRKYERFVVEMLNMCTTFDVARLHARLKLFLQGANKFEFSVEELRVLIEDMKRRDVVFEENGVLKLRQYFG